MPHDRHDHHHAFGSQWWEDHYQQGDPAAHATASPHVVAALDRVPTGAVLDAGCGTGADAIWLAERGWDVTAVDISATAVERARARAATVAPALPIDWVVADLVTWTPPRQYQAVVSQYVHPDLPFGEFVTRLADAVAPGGVLLVVGHDHADSHSSEHAPRDASIGTAAVTDALGSDWRIETARTSTRTVGQLTLTDTVVLARRS